MKVVEHEPLRGWVEQVRAREARGGPLGAEVPAGEHEHRDRAERDDSAWLTSSSSGSGHTHQSGAKSTTIGSKWAPRREICSPGEPRQLEKVPVCRRPDGLNEVPEVEAPGLERPMLEDGKCREHGCEACGACPEQPTAARSSPRDRGLEQLAPRRTEHGLVRALLVGLPTAAPSVVRSAASPARRLTAAASASGSLAGTSNASRRR